MVSKAVTLSDAPVLRDPADVIALVASAASATKIDYLSFTLRGNAILPVFEGDVAGYAQNALEGAFPGIPSLYAALGKPTARKGRSGYRYGVVFECGLTLFFGSPVSAPLVEAGGSACDVIRKAGAMTAVLECYGDFITRIDLARDIVTDVTPAEFLAAGRSPRHKATSGVDSPTGQTRYVGSPSSDRFLRVYRYFAPHPRAAFLRVEIVLRRDCAKYYAQAVLQHEPALVQAEALAPFALQAMPSHGSAETLEPVPSAHNTPTDAKRLMWLTKQVKPALLEAHRAGLINLHAWLSEIT